VSSFLLPKTLDFCLLEARQACNDSQPPFRNPDATLVGYFNSGLLATYSLRPDAFLGNFQTGILSFQGVPSYTVNDLQTIDGVDNPTPPLPATPFPLDQRQFYNPLVSYIAGRIEIADDEYSENSRSQQLLAAFSQQLRGM
jgi:hypothetical protein